MAWQWQQMTNIDVSTVFCFGVTYISTFCGLFYLFLVFQTPTDTYTDVETILTNLHFVDDDNINFYDFTLENFRQLARFVATKPAFERTTDKEERIKQAPEFLKQKLIFVQWLKLVGLYHKYWFKLQEQDISSLEDAFFLNDSIARKIFGNDYDVWFRGIQTLRTSKHSFETLKNSLWTSLIDLDMTEVAVFKTFILTSVTVLSVIISTIFTFCVKTRMKLMRQRDVSLLDRLTGRCLDPHSCRTSNPWRIQKQVENTLKFDIRRNGRPYPICDRDRLQVNIRRGRRHVPYELTIGGTEPDNANLVTVNFAAKKSGDYVFEVLLNETHINGSPFSQDFLPGPTDPTMTILNRQCSVIVCRMNDHSLLEIQMRDMFKNAQSQPPNEDSIKLYQCAVDDLNRFGTSEVCTSSFYYDFIIEKFVLDMLFTVPGSYRAQVTYMDKPIRNGMFTCVVLNDNAYEEMNVNINNRIASYEVKLTRIIGKAPFKPRRVMLFISSKQITIKECLMKFLYKRLATFRTGPSTKFQLLEETANGIPSFSIEDAKQPAIVISSEDREVITATFTKFLLKNIGGSETFTERKRFFFREVRSYHKKHKRETIQVCIDRRNLLKSSFEATRNFSAKEWCDNFEIIFRDEIGVDYGGLRREWFELICKNLFQSRSGLFKSFDDNPQSLVHPNPHMKLKYFEFAGKVLGKSVYESALDIHFGRFVTANFTRSFLAQLIGLHINYKSFESDDPDLYVNKVLYLLNQDVTDMDLYFVDEEYNSRGSLLKVVDLIPGGSKIRVTNQSKRRYLDALAQYRLVNCVKDEVEAFLKGLNELIPNNLLCIFDESELELLLCGTGTFSLEDFQSYSKATVPYPPSPNWERVLKWFWMAVSNFTAEEMARLLQFTTGCSQLPPRGFRDLNPPFTIIESPCYGKLPTARTCFNQLWLPHYDTYEELEKSLMLAITEGKEGFGLV